MKRRTLLTWICFLSIAIDSTNFVISLKCKAGEHRPPTDIRTSGYASQCSGVSKITTEAECKLAAEYNSKNNIDKNVGFGSRYRSSRVLRFLACPSAENPTKSPKKFTCY